MKNPYKNIKYLFGIKITKPFSKEMYAHNDKVAEEMKRNITSAINKAYENVIIGDGEDTNLREIVKAFTGYSFGEGYDIDDIKAEGLDTLENVANWQMHEEYAYLCFKSLVPRIKQGMVGFGWSKMNYWTEDEVSNSNEHKIERIKEIGGDDLRWSSHSDKNGNITKVPYIKAFNKSDAEGKALALRCNNVDAEVDCYEADDGDDERGRPIMLKFWSVRIKNY